MSSSAASAEPPRAPPSRYGKNATRWEKEKAVSPVGAFESPEDPVSVGPWILGETVGKGASGRVRLARHKVTGTLAACKILSAKDVAASRASLAAAASRSDKQRLGIDREIVMMKLMDHPSIIRMYDVWETDHYLYLILEYVDGGELFDYLVNRGRLPVPQALGYFKQIISGLQYCHSFGIIHRDLKPENILLCGNNLEQVKIADWGMAALQLPSNQLETSCGSPHYASPEIVNGDRYEGAPSDIWSSGVILFALLTGRLPFDDKNIRTLLDKVKIGRYQVPQYVDDRAKDLISKMLVVDSSKRITIPQILEHPFMRQDTPGITIVPPPTLGKLMEEKPISAATLENDIVENLSVIWGNKSEMVVEELLSPEPNVAKAFYFLVMRFRDKALESYNSHGECDVSTVRPYAEPHLSRPPRRKTARDPSGSPKKQPASLGTSEHHPSPAQHPVRGSSVPSPSRIKPLPPKPLAPVHAQSSPIFAVPNPPKLPRINVDKPAPDTAWDFATPTATSRPGSQPLETPTPTQLSFIKPPAVQNPELMRTMETMAEAVNMLVPIHNAKQTSSTAPSKTSMASKKQLIGADKENASPSQPAARDTLMPGGYNTLGRSNGTIRSSVPLGGHNEQRTASSGAKFGDKRKSRPAPLDFSRHMNQNVEQSLLSAHSPLLSPLPSPFVVSPVAEIRGWFTNLFHWKAQTFVLLSRENCLSTRDEAYKILESIGVVAVLEDVDGWGILRCKFEEVHDAEGNVVYKSVRFRLEFAPVINSRTSAPALTPVIDKFPSTCVSTVTMVLEKGALSTFKAVHGWLQAAWRLDTEYPSTNANTTAMSMYEQDDVFVG